MFAPKGEKQLYKAIQAKDTEAIKRVGAEHPDFRLPSYSLAGLMIMNDEPSEAERLLAEAFATGEDPAEDKVRFAIRYSASFTPKLCEQELRTHYFQEQ
jgi:hypothetical protein